MPAGFHIPFVAFFGRTLAECLDMFALSADELRGTTTLDCPSGPDSFVAEGCDAGLSITGCDPMFAHEPAELARLARANVERCLSEIESQNRAEAGTLVFRDYAAFRAAKLDALERFLADYAANRHRYVAARLPDLPFADGSFDRVCAANFLLTYAPRAAGGLYDGEEFDLAFHLRSVESIARIARREIRIAPMGSFDPPPRPHAYRDPIRARLEALGWRTELVPSGLDSGLASFNDLLIARRRGAAPTAR